MKSTIFNKSNVRMVPKSISVPEHLWHRICVRAAQERKTIQVVLAEALEQYLSAGFADGDSEPETAQPEAHG